jgi:hypothetical protein
VGWEKGRESACEEFIKGVSKSQWVDNYGCTLSHPSCVLESWCCVSMCRGSSFVCNTRRRKKIHVMEDIW